MRTLRSVLPYMLIFGCALALAIFDPLPRFRPSLSLEQAGAMFVALCYAIIGAFGCLTAHRANSGDARHGKGQEYGSDRKNGFSMLSIALLLATLVYVDYNEEDTTASHIMMVIAALVVCLVANFGNPAPGTFKMKMLSGRVNAISGRYLSPTIMAWAGLSQVGVVRFSPLAFLTVLFAFSFFASTVVGLKAHARALDRKKV